MTTPRRVVIVGSIVAALLLAFAAFVRSVSLTSFNFAGIREVRTLLDASMLDQKRLSRLDPQRDDEYRRRFDTINGVVRRLDIVALNRDAIARRYEMLFLAAFAAMVVVSLLLYATNVRKRERRLERLQRSLEALSRGEVDLAIGERGKDLIGRIASMVEATSRDIGRDRRRLQYLDHLSAWQEAARRHAHEIRTPLTAARLELDRFALRASAVPALAVDVLQAQASIREELDRLADFTRQFTSFARVGQPRLTECDLWHVVEEFRAMFTGAWPEMQLALEPTTCDCRVLVDKEMLRQVLVNLCNNASLAGATMIAFSISDDARRLYLTVSDDGPGIDAAIRPRLFEPYVTTRPIGEGMGLGLAISKKILLDHGGDLELVDEARRGATFRLTLPKPGAHA